MTQPIIEFVEVRHQFRDHWALNGASFEVAPQSLHGFVGPNGAGKTTSLKLVCTLLPPQMGRVRVFGRDVRLEQKSIRQRLGFMPDHFSMYRQMTVFEYLDFFAAAYGLPLRKRDQVVGDVLSLTDMEGRKDDLIQGLSRGMQQRVGLARVLVHDPELLLLDEPASGLDPRARIELMEILRELRRMGKTIFISSHILSELAELCDSVTIIDRGKTRYSGSMDGLLEKQTEHPTYLLKTDGDLNLRIEQLKAIDGIVEASLMEGRTEIRLVYNATQTDNNRVLQRLIESDIPIVGFQKETRHLNEAFMDLTERGVRT